MSTATQTPMDTLLTTVEQHLSNDDTDSTLVRILANEAATDATREDIDSLIEQYDDWAYAVKELKFAEDAYYNAESDSDEEADAESDKQQAEEEVSGHVFDIKNTMRTLRQA